MKQYKKRVYIITILLHALLLITAYVFQGMIFTFVRLGGLVPLLLPIVVAGVALYEGRYVGGIMGLFAGILCDISFNNPIGTFTVFLTLAGLAIGTLADMVVVRGFVTYYIACGATLVLSAIVQMLPLMMLQDVPLGLLLGTAIPQTLYSLALAFPFWFSVRALGKRAERYTPSNIPEENKVNTIFGFFKSLVRL